MKPSKTFTALSSCFVVEMPNCSTVDITGGNPRYAVLLQVIADVLLQRKDTSYNQAGRLAPWTYLHTKHLERSNNAFAQRPPTTNVTEIDTKSNHCLRNSGPNTGNNNLRT